MSFLIKSFFKEFCHGDTLDQFRLFNMSETNAPHALKIEVEAYNLKLETFFDYS